MSFILPRAMSCICASDDAVGKNSEKEYKDETVSNEFLRRIEQDFVATRIWYSSLYWTTARVRFELTDRKAWKIKANISPCCATRGNHCLQLWLPLSGPYEAILSERIVRKSKRTTYRYIVMAERWYILMAAYMCLIREGFSGVSPFALGLAVVCAWMLG